MLALRARQPRDDELVVVTEDLMLCAWRSRTVVGPGERCNGFTGLISIDLASLHRSDV